MNDLKEQLRKESLRLHEDTEHTFKAHFVTAEKWENLNLCLGIPSIVLSVMAGSLALSKIVPYFEILAGIFGFAAATFTALLTFLKPIDRYEKRLKCGNRYLALRNDMRRFFEIELYTDKSDNELKAFLDTLISKKKELDVESPLILNWAYKKAKERIKSGEAEYEVDKDAKK
ncbi:MAG: SLATT domain-containing protein [Thermodesulfobacteriota bacterium]